MQRIHPSKLDHDKLRFIWDMEVCHLIGNSDQAYGNKTIHHSEQYIYSIYDYGIYGSIFRSIVIKKKSTGKLIEKYIFVPFPKDEETVTLEK